MTAEYVDKSTGEVLTPEEWAESSTEVALLHADTSALDNADPATAAVMVTQALQESRQWLAVAMRGTDPTPIAEFKAWAATIEEATRQKKLGREIELDAAEMVRRAERGIGVAIRRGQEAGEIETTAEAKRRAGLIARGVQHSADNNVVPKARPVDFAKKDELHNNGAGIYALTDGVTDEQFDEAIEEAKAEGNLSRANVVRKATGREPRPADRPELLRKTRHHDANRIVEQTVIALEGLALGVPLIDFDQLDPAQISAWSGSLATSLQSLNRMSRRLKELDQA